MKGKASENAPGTRAQLSLSLRVAVSPPGPANKRTRVPASWLLEARPGPEPGWGSSWWDRSPDRRWRRGLWLGWVGHHSGEQPRDFHL